LDVVKTLIGGFSMTYFSFIAGFKKFLEKDQPKIKLPNGKVLSIEAWEKQLRVFHVDMDTVMHGVEITLLFNP
jgi:hypothetical protein